jgi:signal-transduction protein with cAMP-binding, CBS, and nucleotidyltransferase domain
MAAGDAVGMQEIARFLAVHKPFDGLAPEALEQTAATVEVAYFPRGASILQQGGEPSRHLYVIVKGTVELRQVDEGDASELVVSPLSNTTVGLRWPVQRRNSRRPPMSNQPE